MSLYDSLAYISKNLSDNIPHMSREEAKRTRTRQAMLFLSLLGFGLFFVSARSGDDRFVGVLPFPDVFSYLAAALFLLIGIGLIIYFYVQGEPFIEGYKVLQSNDALDVDLAVVHERLGNVEESLSALSNKLEITRPVGDSMADEIATSVKQKAHDKLWQELKDISSEDSSRERAISPIRSAYESARDRLLKEVEALGRRGTINLIFGVLTTLAALGVLLTLALDSVSVDSYKLISSDGSIKGVALALILVPKLSLAIFIQVFSLFFLRLYRSGLSEIKYFQNELTNLEAKYLGVVSAVISEEAETISDASKSLLAVERNHVLNKGQTTIELEKHRVEHKSSAYILKYLPNIIGRK